MAQGPEDYTSAQARSGSAPGSSTDAAEHTANASIGQESAFGRDFITVTRVSESGEVPIESYYRNGPTTVVPDSPGAKFIVVVADFRNGATGPDDACDQLVYAGVESPSGEEYARFIPDLGSLVGQPSCTIPKEPGEKHSVTFLFEVPEDFDEGTVAFEKLNDENTQPVVYPVDLRPEA
ncbi:hypothetical protein GCM10027157_09660 [Corynebacterium aquatimens]